LLYTGEGELELGLDAGHANNAHVRGGPARVIKQRRQPDAGVAPQYKSAALPGPHIGEETVDELELLPPVEQH
jgi:hypothetical protein